MDKGKRAILGTAFGEIVIVSVLVLLILLSLNYFRILSINQSVPFLSFLPQQVSQRINTQTAKGVAGFTSVKSIVTPNKPLIASSDGDGAIYEYISSSSASLAGKQTRIDVEIEVDNETDSSGIIFSNGKNFNEKEHRGIRIFRYAKTKNWLLAYTAEGKTAYTVLTKSSSDPDFKNFSILIGPNGKMLNIISSSFQSKTITLEHSFYNNNSVTSAYIQAASNSTTTLYSLYYQTYTNLQQPK